MGLPLQEFFRAYLDKSNAARKQLLYVMNPNKFMACQFLVQYHERVRPPTPLTQRQPVTLLDPFQLTSLEQISRVESRNKRIPFPRRSDRCRKPHQRRSQRMRYGGLQLRDKIIVFSDDIFALREYAVKMRRPMIYGGTSHQERTRILAKFKHSSDVRLYADS